MKNRENTRKIFSIPLLHLWRWGHIPLLLRNNVILPFNKLQKLEDTPIEQMLTAADLADRGDRVELKELGELGELGELDELG